MENRNLTLCNVEINSLNTLYEDLRDEALRTFIHEGRKGQGLALFIREGMASWAEAWTHCIFPHFQDKEKGPGYSPQDLPVDLRGQVVILLTNMALNAWQEVKAI